MKNIAIFASGSGTNAENLIRFFRTSPFGKVRIVLSNRADAGVIDRAQSLEIETLVFTREQFYNSDEIVELLTEREINYIVLAGFLWLVPVDVIEAFHGRIINIHPALLPRFGGKGMYGDRVHRAALARGVTVSGCTVHLVTEEYDAGPIVLQSVVAVEPDDDADSLAYRVFRAECEALPEAIGRWASGRLEVIGSRVRSR